MDEDGPTTRGGGQNRCTLSRRTNLECAVETDREKADRQETERKEEGARHERERKEEAARYEEERKDQHERDEQERLDR